MRIVEIENLQHYHELDILSTRFDTIYNLLAESLSDVKSLKDEYRRSNNYTQWAVLLNVLDIQIHQFIKIAQKIQYLDRYFRSRKVIYIDISKITKQVSDIVQIRKTLDAKNIIEAEQAKKHLICFDIDDTLLHTTAKIGVIKDGRTVARLSNQQFNDYVLKQGEQFDFSEFRDSLKFHTESTPITRMIAKLKHKMRDPRNVVIFLTARADFDDRDLFLLTFKNLGIDMSRIHVHRAGNLPGDESPAQKKAVWVRQYLDTDRYSAVSLYDDSNQNLRVFKSLENEYPSVDFHAYHVSDGRTRTVEQSV